MTPRDLLNEVEALGVRVRVDGTHLLRVPLIVIAGSGHRDHGFR